MFCCPTEEGRRRAIRPLLVNDNAPVISFLQITMIEFPRRAVGWFSHMKYSFNMLRHAIAVGWFSHMKCSFNILR